MTGLFATHRLNTLTTGVTTARALRVALMLVTMAAPVSVARGQDRGTADSAVTESGTPIERADSSDLAATLLAKWAPHVEAAYGVDAEVWRERMARSLAHTDIHNLRESLRRGTYESAMAALVGRRAGGPADAHRPVPLASAADAAASAARLGDLAADLTYTPLQPCRIVDTRSTAGGAIAANSTRSFLALSASGFSSQGGSATDCGTPTANAAAIAINITVVSPAGPGFATVFPYGTTQPLTSSVNYATGDILANSMIARIPNPLATNDFTIYTFAQSHFVVDIVGYFAAPIATAADCVETGATVVNLAAGAAFFAVAPVCPAGFTATSTNCELSDVNMRLWTVRNGACAAKNDSASSGQISATRTCCRVPGR